MKAIGKKKVTSKRALLKRKKEHISKKIMYKEIFKKLSETERSKIDRFNYSIRRAFQGSKFYLDDTYHNVRMLTARVEDDIERNKDSVFTNEFLDDLETIEKNLKRGLTQYSIFTDPFADIPRPEDLHLAMEAIYRWLNIMKIGGRDQISCFHDDWI